MNHNDPTSPTDAPPRDEPASTVNYTFPGPEVREAGPGVLADLRIQIRDAIERIQVYESLNLDGSGGASVYAGRASYAHVLRGLEYLEHLPRLLAEMDKEIADIRASEDPDYLPEVALGMARMRFIVQVRELVTGKAPDILGELKGPGQ